MFMIQVFGANREFLLTIPMPHPLSEYENLVRTAESELPEDALNESEVLNAELLGLLTQDTQNPEVMANITGLIMSLVFADPTVRKDFRLKASNHTIQVALPRTPRDEASIQWVRLTNEQRDKMLAAMDPEMVLCYRDQIEESVRYLTQFAEDLRMRTKSTMPARTAGGGIEDATQFLPLNTMRRLH